MVSKSWPRPLMIREEENGTVFYEAVMQWDQSDKGHVRVDQVVVERWANGKIAHIRFYGNFDPGLPAS